VPMAGADGVSRRPGQLRNLSPFPRAGARSLARH
jgi:hypothetical protein